jgi:HEAT repeat protein
MRCLHAVLITMALLVPGGGFAQTPPATLVLRHTDSRQTLAERWEWARREAASERSTGGYWVGYSFARLMPENSFIGTFYSDQKRNEPSLLEVITGVHEELPPSMHHDDGTFSVMEGIMTFDEKGRGQKSIAKEVGILFHFPDPGLASFDGIKVSNLSLHVELAGNRLIWLGGAEEEQSVPLLTSVLRKTLSDDQKRSVVRAIGLHRQPDVVFPVLRDIAQGTEHASIRKEALEWIGQIPTDAALEFLVNTATSDPSEAIREGAIVAIGENEHPNSLEALITLAGGHHDAHSRQTAMFWLGQRASEKAVSALETIAADDEDTQVQKSAVIALTQLPNNGGVLPLIKIARKNANPRIRKEAIYWLGQCEDERALEALVEMVRE